MSLHVFLAASTYVQAKSCVSGMSEHPELVENRKNGICAFMNGFGAALVSLRENSFPMESQPKDRFPFNFPNLVQ